jgi:very-short-patch-repair endonuclease
MRHPLRDRARQLRKQMTDTEQFVWAQLRRKQFDGFRFRRQFPVGSYIVDFVCLEARVILELDGGQHAEQQEADQRRTQWLESQGFKLLRFWNHIALTEWDSVEQVLWQVLKESKLRGQAK